MYPYEAYNVTLRSVLISQDIQQHQKIKTLLENNVNICLNNVSQPNVKK